jgi:hypothetical protein
MSWDVAIFGDLEFSPGGLKKWKSLVADKGAFADWKEDFACATAPKNAVARPVSKVIADLERAGEELFRFDASDEHVRLRAMFPKDPYYDWCPVIATIFRVAAQVGGEGEMYFVGYMTIQFAYRFQIRNGKSSYEKLEDAAREAAERSAGYRDVDDMVQSRLRELMGGGGAASK